MLSTRRKYKILWMLFKVVILHLSRGDDMEAKMCNEANYSGMNRYSFACPTKLKSWPSN